MNTYLTGEPMDDHAEADARQWRRDRRERIATAALIGILSDPGFRMGPPRVANDAIVYADELIAQLDKEPQP